jgi:UDP-2,3-diacylglucosamine hydrolase
MTNAAATSDGNVGLIAGGGALPFAVADALIARGRKPVLLAMRGFCDDPARLAAYQHDWIAVGQLGRLSRLLRAGHCRDVMFIGAMVRPSLSEIRLDWATLRAIPRIAAAFRGGDDHLLKGIAALFESEGFRLVGIPDLVPELLIPTGQLTRLAPDQDAQADIARGMAMLNALSPFDVGQACVVIDGNIVAIEDIAGTDALLARVVQLRESGRLRTKQSRGVLVKASKSGQDLRFDLPTLGPRTIEGAIAAGLAGIAVVAGRALMAEPQLMISSADRAGLFITGLPATSS